MPKIAELVLISVEKSTSAPRSLKGKERNDLKHVENGVTSLFANRLWKQGMHYAIQSEVTDSQCCFTPTQNHVALAI